MSFDYIIVGAGSAGCVLANRLSANPATRVCLIEAGPADRNPMIHMPFGLAALAHMRWLNWGHETDAEAQLHHRRLFWPRGRVLGGSSSINAMIYMRGHPQDYRDWARLAGPDWDWPRVRAIFKDHEDNLALRDDHHGQHGPLTVSDLAQPNPLSRAFVRAGVESRLAENPDFNGTSQEGVGLYQVTQRGGRRLSSAQAFLVPVLDRPNLTLITKAQVHRVAFEGRRATGVQLRDQTLPLAQGGEVILSGGAINSPQLLMLSGIGPGAHLQAMDIPVLHDAPEVGANLADHLDITVQAALKGREAIGIAPGFLPRALRATWAYLLRGQGEFTSNVAEAGGFARSDPSRERPNLQFHFIPAYLHDHGRRLSLGYGLTLHVCDLLPKSRGRISLATPDPMAHPRINANYLADPEDLPTLLAGLKLARRILNAPALACYVATETLPGARLVSDADLKADIRTRAETIYHPVGTCRMGLDAGSVTDPEGRVRGTEGLRVVDASLMPQIIAGNTNAPTMMIAETIARRILRQTPAT
ncbi:GMC family oxidoreductase [Tabrizicola sp.]|uniref:GMC family oxidoreductase n=1 Tax=Tabrizicola sp. TaxID=2005166 RepID=UPI002732A03D|nr:GMC family oxidoreductase N-terminal domain-containing protein [Tabrizicola sp.]MDP3197075.1 GMC family oxidoreductase N-terminal domain-containing protein [Tabrizicola sp.]